MLVSCFYSVLASSFFLPLGELKLYKLHALLSRPHPFSLPLGELKFYKLHSQLSRPHSFSLPSGGSGWVTLSLSLMLSTKRESATGLR
ncbi:Uncharacterised protein [Segatella oris]|uniref:Uncharacterized protein n=1 Tax=Segatella oris TaxID=28135 RepID=A0A3S4TDK6_9BACT|nr:Uncharacterised protein [Segatella oris]